MTSRFEKLPGRPGCDYRQVVENRLQIVATTEGSATLNRRPDSGPFIKTTWRMYIHLVEEI
jgi:hypothetical protein